MSYFLNNIDEKVFLQVESNLSGDDIADNGEEKDGKITSLSILSFMWAQFLFISFPCAYDTSLPVMSTTLQHFSNFVTSDVAFDSDQLGEDEEGDGIVLQAEEPRYPWEGSDRDYTYEEVCLIP